MNGRSRTTCLVLLLTVSLPISITAQSNLQQEAPRPIIDSARVNVVNVDVFVTDDKGRPVTDLGPEDFELFENGEPMRLTNFARVD